MHCKGIFDQNIFLWKPRSFLIKNKLITVSDCNKLSLKKFIFSSKGLTNLFYSENIIMELYNESECGQFNILMTLFIKVIK